MRKPHFSCSLGGVDRWFAGETGWFPICLKQGLPSPLTRTASLEKGFYATTGAAYFWWRRQTMATTSSSRGVRIRVPTLFLLQSILVGEPSQPNKGEKGHCLARYQGLPEKLLERSLSSRRRPRTMRKARVASWRLSGPSASSPRVSPRRNRKYQGRSRKQNRDP